MTRKTTPTAIETAVLVKSARRCALCFSLTGDLLEKLGQIAHLDQDPSNTSEDNLAFLCLLHHTLYDSKTSQHKNYTKSEVKVARLQLYECVENGKHHLQPVRASKRSEIIEVRQIELAEEAVEIFSQLPGIFRYIRSPFGSSDEGSSIASEREEINDHVSHIALERLRTCEELFKRLDAIRHKFVAYFGMENRMSFEVVLRTRGEILAAAEALLVAIDPISRTKAESIIWFHTVEADDLDLRIQRATDQILKVCQSVLREDSTTQGIRNGQTKPADLKND
ncbi:hypothetical protein KF913_07725 [Candidatus Obscuribacterales bacterium]|nr:hypothetical protein [Candidatus Obscuribacterales bacterium]